MVAVAIADDRKGLGETSADLHDAAVHPPDLLHRVEPAGEQQRLAGGDEVIAGQGVVAEVLAGCVQEHLFQLTGGPGGGALEATHGRIASFAERRMGLEPRHPEDPGRDQPADPHQPGRAGEGATNLEPADVFGHGQSAVPLGFALLGHGRR